MLLLCAVGGAKAETETIFLANAIATSDQSFSSGTTEITSAQATITGGKMYAINGQDAAKNLITKDGVFSMTNNNTIFKIELNSALAVGDVITAKSQGGVKNEVNKGLWITTTEDRPSSAPACSAAAETPTTMTANFLNYTVTESDGYVGATTLYVHRAAGATQNFDEFKITRELEATAPEITTQPVSASYKQNAAATALTVAATASAGTLSYQWYSNTTATTEGATALDGETTASFTPSTATLGTTYYYCAVTDANATTNSSFATITVANTFVVGYTEAISGTTLLARSLTSEDANVTITGPSYGSNITDQGSKSVYIDNTAYTNNKSWRKSQNGVYDGQNVGYTLTVASGYKMNISHVAAKIAVADDTYTWYVEILNGAGTQVWKSGEKTTTKASAGSVDADVTDKEAIQGLTGNITVNLYVKQGGSTKYFSINYLQLTAALEVDERPTYAMSVSQNIEAAGSVTPADGAEVTEGESVSFTATPNTAYKFVKWTIDGVDQTDNPYTLENVTATHTAVATFAQRYTVTYDLGTYAGTTSKVLNNVNRGNNYDEVYSDDNDQYTIPAYADKYLYREGYVFDKWQDGDGNTYLSGETIDMTKNITLTPTFIATTHSLSQSFAPTEVTWTFAKADILFADWQSDSEYGYHTQNVTVNGEKIAVPMKITKGKVGNWGRTDAIAQTNPNTTFTIPAISGMIIEIPDAYVNISTTTIAGSTDYEGTGTKTVSYTYTGDASTIDIVMGENNQYLTSIVVTYPVTLTSVSKTISEAGYATYCSPYPLDFTGSGLTAYIATVAGDEVSFTEVTSVPANTGVLLKGTAGEKTISVAESSTDVSANVMTGVLVDTEIAAEAGFVLMGSGDAGVAFYKNKNAFTVGANTAYIPASGTLTRSFIGFDFDEATAIKNLTPALTAGEAAVYNLRGQRVKNLTKGLYIMNGKKVVK